jgi:hypothetical protein
MANGVGSQVQFKLRFHVFMSHRTTPRKIKKMTGKQPGKDRHVLKIKPLKLNIG